MILANKMRLFLRISSFFCILALSISLFRIEKVYDMPLFEMHIEGLSFSPVYEEVAGLAPTKIDRYEVTGTLEFDTPRSVFYFEFPRNDSILQSDITVEWITEDTIYQKKLDTEDLDMQSFERTVFSSPWITGLKQSVQFRITSLSPIDMKSVKLISSDTVTARKKISLDFWRPVWADTRIVSRKDWWANEEYRYKDSTVWKKRYEEWAKVPPRPLTDKEKYAIALNKEREEFLVSRHPDTTKYVSLVRKEGDRPLVWPIEKVKQVNRIVIHHTAENLDKEADDETLLRAIYQYHAVSRGWGDIWYNYVIWQRWTIYEWRAGGDYVIWAHAMWNNAGTVGVSVMGNFEKISLNRDQKQGLEEAISFLAKKYGITLSAQVDGVKVCDTNECRPFLQVRTPSLLGHRDVGTTSCPGANIYKELPSLVGKYDGVYAPVYNPISGPIEEPEKKIEQKETDTMMDSVSRLVRKYSPPMKSKLSPGPEVKVRLSYPESQDSVSLASGTEKNTFLFVGKRRVLLKSSDQVVITASGKILEATVWKKKYRWSPVSVQWDLVVVPSWSRIPAWDSVGKYNDNVFRNRVVVRNNEWKIELVNELPLEYYLKWMGEVSEWDAKSIPEKVKTIIVSARSYALYYQSPKLPTEKRKFPGKPYDISDNPDESQKYLGYSYELRSPTVATFVDETNREVIWFGNELVKAWYSTSTDGKTLSYKEYCESRGLANCSDIPYLQSVEDPAAVGRQRLGHGVGISGVGATYFASQWWWYKQIIEYYLSGTTVAKK